jgi:hypothetical protein
MYGVGIPGERTGITAFSRYSYFIQVLLLLLGIPTSYRYYCFFHVLLVSPGIPTS